MTLTEAWSSGESRQSIVGIDKMDRVFLKGNPIDCAAQAANIDALRESAGFVDVDCE